MNYLERVVHRDGRFVRRDHRNDPSSGEIMYFIIESSTTTCRTIEFLVE